MIETVGLGLSMRGGSRSVKVCTCRSRNSVRLFAVGFCCIMIPMRGDIMRLAFALLAIFLLATAAAAEEDESVYRLSEGDQVKFLVWGEGGLSITTLVLEDGSLSFPLVGRLVVEGLTLAEVEEKCRVELETYLIDPMVNVIVISPHVPRVKVLGKVTKPGKFITHPGDNLLDAIAYAGGFDERCDVRHILILNENGSRMVDLKELLKGEEPVADIDLSLMDGDFIFVPEVGRPDWDKATTYINGIIQSLIVISSDW